MSDNLVLPTSVGFNKLKGIGQFQLAYLWKLRIILNSYLLGFISQGEIDDIIITARTMSAIPGFTRSKARIRYMDREYTVPMGMTYTGDHEFTCDILMDENGKIYKQLFKWYRAIPAIVSQSGLQYAKCDALMLLYSMDSTTVKRSFQITGIYPMEVPEMTGWNQDSLDEHIKVTLKFAFDEVIPFNNIGSNLENTMVG